MTALHPLHDEELGRLLKDISRQDASSDFTDKVLERLAAAPPRRTAWGPRTAWPVAAAVALGIWFGQMVRSERREQVRAAENLEQMQNEYRELRSELDRLRRLTSDVEPVLELGGTERMDFIFDLRVLADEQSERSERRAEPVSHSPR